MTIQAGIQELSDGNPSGTRLGLDTSELISFHGAAPVNQAGATEDLGVALSDKGFRAVGTAYPITTSGAVTLTGTFSVTDLTVTNDLTIGDAGNIILNTTTGTQIGTATGQKIGLYGATPVIQSIATTDLGTVLSDLGARAVGTAYPITTSGAVAMTGSVTSGAAVIGSGIQTIAAGGTTTAASLTVSLVSVDADAGGDIVTLADGTIGQEIEFAMLSATGVLTLTPANLSGGTSVTMNAAGETVRLRFVDTEWYIMGGNAFTII